MDAKVKKAFLDIYGRHFRDVYAYVAYRVMPDREAAKDITQDVFMAALKGLPKYRGDAPLLSWLRSIARFKIADYFRAAAAMKTSSLGELAAETYAQLTNREEQALIISNVMKELPVKYADLLEEKYLEGISVAEIARRRGENYKAVESNLTRAREAFRQVLTRLNQAREVVQ